MVLVICAMSESNWSIILTTSGFLVGFSVWALIGSTVSSVPAATIILMIDFISKCFNKIIHFLILKFRLSFCAFAELHVHVDGITRKDSPVGSSCRMLNVVRCHVISAATGHLHVLCASALCGNHVYFSVHSLVDDHGDALSHGVVYRIRYLYDSLSEIGRAHVLTPVTR